MTSAVIDMEDVALMMGVHYDTFRHEWRTWCAQLGFPEPVLGRARPYRWSSAAVVDWLARRSKLERPNAPKPQDRAAAAWAQLERLRG